MLKYTLGYILCCQSPALFLLAVFLLISFIARRKAHRARAVVDLILCIVSVAAGVVLYYLGMLYKFFVVEELWKIRTAGWVGLTLAGVLIVYLLFCRARKAYRVRVANKEAARKEDAHRQELEHARAEAYEAGRAAAGSGESGSETPGQAETTAEETKAESSADI